MAHLSQLVVVILPADKDHHVVAAVAAVCSDGDVPGLPGGVHDPVLISGVDAGTLGAGGVVGSGVRYLSGHGLIQPGGEVLALGLVISGPDGLGGLLCGGQGLGGHFLGGLAVFTGSFGLFSGHIVVGQVKIVLLAVIAGVLLLQLCRAVLQRFGVGGQGLAGQGGVAVSLTHHVDVDAGAVVCGKELVCTGVALRAGVFIHAGKAAFHSVQVFLAQRNAVLGGIVPQGLFLNQFGLGVFQEVILPADALAGHGAGLTVQSLDAAGGIQPEEGGIAAVLVGPVIVLVGVVIAHLRGGVILIAHSQCGGFEQQVGVKQQDQGDQQADRNGAQGPAAFLPGLFFGFLLQSQRLFVGAGLAGGLTEFLFGRCAHGMSSFLIVSLACRMQTKAL